MLALHGALSASRRIHPLPPVHLLSGRRVAQRRHELGDGALRRRQPVVMISRTAIIPMAAGIVIARKFC
jgi:hypothetical protein